MFDLKSLRGRVLSPFLACTFFETQMVMSPLIFKKSSSVVSSQLLLLLSFENGKNVGIKNVEKCWNDFKIKYKMFK